MQVCHKCRRPLKTFRNCAVTSSMRVVAATVERAFSIDCHGKRNHSIEDRAVILFLAHKLFPHYPVGMRLTEAQLRDYADSLISEIVLKLEYEIEDADEFYSTYCDFVFTLSLYPVTNTLALAALRRHWSRMAQLARSVDGADGAECTEGKEDKNGAEAPHPEDVTTRLVFTDAVRNIMLPTGEYAMRDACEATDVPQTLYDFSCLTPKSSDCVYLATHIILVESNWGVDRVKLSKRRKEFFHAAAGHFRHEPELLGEIALSVALADTHDPALSKLESSLYDNLLNAGTMCEFGGKVARPSKRGELYDAFHTAWCVLMGIAGLKHLWQEDDVDETDSCASDEY